MLFLQSMPTDGVTFYVNIHIFSNSVTEQLLAKLLFIF